jgi:protein phosphatase
MANQVLERMNERFGELTPALTQMAKADPSLSGMGTTLTVALSLGADLLVAHVGDSRAYLLTHRKLLPLTKDQTMAELLSELGVIKPEDKTKHHSRHVLTGAITASGEKAPVELHHIWLDDGDQLLLCSDGLTEMVSEQVIESLLLKRKPAQEACQALVDLALQNGGKDNITVIVASYQIPK